jgi:hypothetical protein
MGMFARNLRKPRTTEPELDEESWASFDTKLQPTHYSADDGVHVARLKVLEAFPAIVLVATFLAVFPLGNEAR